MSAVFKPRGPAANKSRHWYQWYDPGTSAAERKLISKLDFFILLYTCLTFFVKYLDQTNVTNSWLAGMRRDLQLPADDLNWFTTYFSIGVIIGAPISTCLLTIVHPRFWLPACTVLWSFCVLFMYKAQNAATLYGLRFCCGLFEAGAYPGAFYIIGSWYTRSEISRRTGIFLFASTVGSMCSGFIQAGLLKHMDGRLGLPAWRWLFILDFCLGIPVAIFGFFVCPDEPKAKRVWWMTEEEQLFAIKRMRDDGRDSDGRWSLDCVKTIMFSWQLWAFTVAWGLVELTCGNNIMRWIGIWLKSAKFDSQAVQILPAMAGFCQMAWIFGSSVAADVLDNRALPFFALAFMQLLCYIVLLVGTSNMSLRFAAYYLATSYSGLSPLLASWLNCSCAGNKQLRSFVSAFMISVGYAIEAPAQQTLFPTSDAPNFNKSRGYVFGVAMVAVTLVWGSVVVPLIIYWLAPKDSCCSNRCEPASEQVDSDQADAILKGSNYVPK